MATIIYGYKFYRILKIVDLAGISDFAITCSINSRMCDDEFNIAGVQFL